MIFTKETICALSSSEFSDADKRLLIQKFFPASGPSPWQRELKETWNDAKRWRKFLGEEPLGIHGFPYRYTHSYLMERGKRMPRERRGNAVTHFSGWVYSLYRDKKEASALAHGKAVERELVRRFIPAPTRSGWDLVCIGLGEHSPPPMVASQLLVNCKPLVGLPDLVFRERSTGQVVIVEVKASNREIPSDGWPNLRVQLWAYSKIDVWANAPSVTLIAEVWGFSAGEIFLRQTIKWDSRDAIFEEENRELFELYNYVS